MTNKTEMWAGNEINKMTYSHCVFAVAKATRLYRERIASAIRAGDNSEITKLLLLGVDKVTENAGYKNLSLVKERLAELKKTRIKIG